MVVVVMTGDMVAMDEEGEEVVEITDHTNTYQTYIVHNNLVMCTIHRFNICDFFQLMQCKIYNANVHCCVGANLEGPFRKFYSELIEH